MPIPYVCVLSCSFFMIGACIASFTACASQRYKSGVGIFSPASKCDSCGRELTFLDLIPIVGWCATHGKCKNCKTHIPVRYPLEELFTGIAFTFCWIVIADNSFTLKIIIQSMYVLLICVCAVIDTEIMEVPYSTWAIMGVLSVISVIVQQISFTTIILILVYTIIFCICMHRGMGWGDIAILVTIPYVFGLMAAALVMMVAGIVGIGVYLLEKITHKRCLTRNEEVDKTIGVRMVPPIAFALLLLVGIQPYIQGILIV
ncbi:MAG: prepilin peptidase [Clostridia bacterium]